MDKKPITVSEAGKRSAAKRWKKHGKNIYKKVGQEGAAIQKRNKKLSSNPKPKTSDGMMTVAEAGVKGGSKTASTHGHEFYQEIGRKGGQKVVAERGIKFFSEIGRKGGEKVSMERGLAFYSEIGSKGASERGKQHEGSKEAEGKVSLEEAGRRGGQRKMLNRIRQKHEKE